MDRKAKQAIIGTAIAFIIIVIVITTAIIKKLTPSDEIMELTEYYKLNENEVLIVMQDRIYEKYGLLDEDTIYLDYQTVNEIFNKRIYWDANENVLLYTTPTEVIRADVGSKDYYINKNKVQTNYEVVKTNGTKVYVAIDFVKDFSDMRYEYYSDPDRVVIEYKWGEYLVSTVKKPTELRYKPNIKSDILVELEENQKLTYVDTSEVVEGGFSKVITKDGVIGYVKNKYITESYYEAVSSDYKAPEYTNITKEDTINLVWHQVTNMDANDNLLSLLEKTKGVTTVSPTWFKITSNEGTITSLASETYVERAHSLGIEVWGLVDDFSPEVSMYELLTYTSRREKLVNELIAASIKYNLDGLNLDFENIPLEAGIHYTQFIRELSVKCRSNGIILSIDNYVPSNFTAYYDKEEQGIVADYVVIMAYDEHHGGSTVSGSVSSIGFVEKAIDDIVTLVPKDKVIIGIPFYTRQWKEVTEESGSISVTSEAYSMSNATALLLNNGIDPVWNEDCAQYYGEYEKDGAIYKLWLEEDESIEAKMKRIHEADVAGVASWKLGLEKESIWNIIIKYVN